MTRNPSSTSTVAPVVMWRMQRPNGLSAHLVVDCDPLGASATWFLNGRAFGMRRFPDVGGALRFSEHLYAQNWAVGWRLVDDDTDDEGLTEE